MAQDVNVNNDAQAEAWNGDEGRYWVEHRERHEKMQRRFTPRLLAAAAVTDADDILDVGCGCGGTTRSVVRATERGKVLGVDLSVPMLAEARRLTADLGPADRVRFEQGDAQSYPFPEADFDVVLSRFGVMFFAEPEAAFANLARALRPGGRLAFLCWRGLGENAFLSVPFGALAKFVPLPELGGPGEPGPFSLADPRRIRDLLSGAGFGRIGVEPVDELLWLGSDVDDVVAYQLGTPTARSMLAAARESDEPAVGRALDALRAELAPSHGPDGVELGGAAWLVTAVRD